VIYQEHLLSISLSRGVWINTSSDIVNKMHMQNEPVYKYAQENCEKSFVSFCSTFGSLFTSADTCVTAVVDTTCNSNFPVRKVKSCIKNGYELVLILMLMLIIMKTNR
jgi:hypothetical protein